MWSAGTTNAGSASGVRALAHADHAVRVIAQVVQPPRGRNLADDVVIASPTAHEGLDCICDKIGDWGENASMLSVTFRSESANTMSGLSLKSLLLDVGDCRGQADQLAQEILRRLVGENRCRQTAWRWSPRGGSKDSDGNRTVWPSFSRTSAIGLDPVPGNAAGQLPIVVARSPASATAPRARPCCARRAPFGRAPASRCCGSSTCAHRRPGLCAQLRRAEPERLARRIEIEPELIVPADLGRAPQIVEHLHPGHRARPQAVHHETTGILPGS